ncbi:MAG: UDP-N-acetylmuramate dehydrogenase [Candidatus Paceibacterota bacterium]
MLEIREYVDIKEYCTLKIGGQFRYFARIKNEDDLAFAYTYAQEKGVSVLPLGGGSNLVFPDGVLNALALKIELLAFTVRDDNDTYADIEIGAGENWDSVVARACAMGLSGVEAMSAIPGTTGATPVQNIGAYGQEIKDTLLFVRVFDTHDFSFKTLSNRECKFAYRNSIFKNEEKGKYVITSIILRLSKKAPSIPNYKGVKAFFAEQGIADPTLAQIRGAIISIRRIKLPDPKEIPNVGSFFENPIVEKCVAGELKNIYPTMPSFDVGNNLVKIPAGWLIENAGLKGKDFGVISTYANNALVLVNNGQATRADIERVRDEITKTIFEKFGITLEQEPEFIT